MTDCLFCKIAQKQINANIVYEDDRAVAFRDVNPQAPMHVLVIPRAHIETLDDVTQENEADIGHLFWVAAKIARDDGVADDGYRTVINCRAHGGQSVYHVHVHLIGGRPLGWPPFPRG
jgi:histidine triad (HIT) family protein